VSAFCDTPNHRWSVLDVRTFRSGGRHWLGLPPRARVTRKKRPRDEVWTVTLDRFIGPQYPFSREPQPCRQRFDDLFSGWTTKKTQVGTGPKVGRISVRQSPVADADFAAARNWL
jgi:hypothetical protein